MVHLVPQNYNNSKSSTLPRKWSAPAMTSSNAVFNGNVMRSSQANRRESFTSHLPPPPPLPESKVGKLRSSLARSFSFSKGQQQQPKRKSRNLNSGLQGSQWSVNSLPAEGNLEQRTEDGVFKVPFVPQVELLEDEAAKRKKNTHRSGSLNRFSRAGSFFSLNKWRSNSMVDLNHNKIHQNKNGGEVGVSQMHSSGNYDNGYGPLDNNNSLAFHGNKENVCFFDLGRAASSERLSRKSSDSKNNLATVFQNPRNQTSLNHRLQQQNVTPHPQLYDTQCPSSSAATASILKRNLRASGSWRNLLLDGTAERFGGMNKGQHRLSNVAKPVAAPVVPGCSSSSSGRADDSISLASAGSGSTTSRTNMSTFGRPTWTPEDIEESSSPSTAGAGGVMSQPFQNQQMRHQQAMTAGHHHQHHQQQHPSQHHQYGDQDQGIDLTLSPGRESLDHDSTSSYVTTGSGSTSSSSGSGGGGGANMHHPNPGNRMQQNLISSASMCSRNSTTSIDSGRESNSVASSGFNGQHHQQSHGLRYQPVTLQIHHPPASHHQQVTVHHHSHPQHNGGGPHPPPTPVRGVRQSIHSSTSSLGSLDRSSRSGGTTTGSIEDAICTLNVHDMIQSGLPDYEIINMWLSDMNFEEYVDLFVASGYDLPTIVKMTPEDLTAIGIKKPSHRKKLKSEISKLNIDDALPTFIPDSLEEWLNLIRLPEYCPQLRSQGYSKVSDVLQISVEDLEDVGIYKLGHQKRFLLAVKRIKEIRSGKRVAIGSSENSSTFQQQPQRPMQQQQQQSTFAPQPPKTPERHYANQRPQQYGSTFSSQQGQSNSSSVYHPDVIQIHHHQQQPVLMAPVSPFHNNGNANNKVAPGPSSFQPSASSASTATLTRQGSRPSVNVYANTAMMAQQRQQQPQQQHTVDIHWMTRSFDDSDVNKPIYQNHQQQQQIFQNHPTNFLAGQELNGGGTLPRPKGLVKPIPVAKISANARLDSNTGEGHQSDFGLDYPVKPKKATSTSSLEPSSLFKLQPLDLKQQQNGGSGSNGGSASGSCHLHFANDNPGTLRIRNGESASQLMAAHAGGTSSTGDKDDDEGQSSPSPSPPPPPLPLLGAGASAALYKASQQGIQQQQQQHLIQQKQQQLQQLQQLQQQQQLQRPQQQIPPGGSENGPTYAVPNQMRAQRSAGDVLNDIGSMLADLTDELDAMLHTERDNQ